MSEALASAPARWWERRLCAVDTETTGPDPEQARIVSCCVAAVGGGEATRALNWLVDPGVEISAEAAAIHGITTARARAEGRPPAEALPQIREAIASAFEREVPVVICNAPYDLTVIDRELRRLGLDPLRIGCVIDPLVLDRFVDKYRKGSRKLDALCAHYGARLDGAHDAAFDALAAARVAYRIAQRNSAIGNASLAKLQELQRKAYREQAEGLQLYWSRKGDARRIDSYDWPVRPWRAA